jgi:PAS domain S-box-containing protein
VLVRGHWIVTADLKPSVGYADLLTAGSFRLSMTLDRMGVGMSGILTDGGFLQPADAMDFVETILEASTEYSIIGKGVDGTILLWNEGARRLYGYEPEEIVGKANADLLHTPESIAAGLPQTMRQAALAFGKWEGTVTRVRRDGSRFTARVVITPRRNRHGEWIGFLLISKDISEEIRLDSTPDAMVIVDQDGRIAVVNRQTEQLFGYQREELLGQPIETLVPEGFHAAHRRHRSGYLAEPGMRPMGAGMELYGRRKDNTEFPVEISLRPMETQQGTLISASVRDITARKQAEEALAQARLAAEQANQAKSEYVSRMSHELRTPLNAILGFAQLLELDGLRDDQRESVGYILSGARHLLGLINEVLDIAAIESGRLSLSLEPVDVADLLTEAVRLIRPLADQQGIVLVDQPHTGDHHVLGDRQRLKQILLNLLSNAVKYNRHGGSVQLGCEAVAGERLRIKVTDTGFGIPAESIERLFVPFDRLGSEQTSIEGTGLGLPLTKCLAEAMGGTLEVASVVGQGSSFWVELPLTQRPTERPQPAEMLPAQDRPERPPSAMTVLYIEDNLSNLQLVERLLSRRPGVTLISAMRPQLGLDLAGEHHPDLILLDLDLPDMPGQEVLRRLLADSNTAHVPIVILSADARPALIARLLQEGAKAFLTKPLDIKELLALLDTITAEQHQARASAASS